MSGTSHDRPFAGRKLHFVGIGGAGMSGLAQIALALGAEVTGSDAAESAYTELLREEGIVPIIGHDRGNVPAAAVVVVSTAIAADNPELAIAQERGQEIMRRGEFLAEVAQLKRCLAIVGTHGKTTTAGMAAHCLVELGLEPAFVIGGQLRDRGTNAGWGAGEWIVLEADESDGSFLLLRPEVAVLTNLELDHHSHYSSLLELRVSCREFLRKIPENGAAVVWDRAELDALLPDHGRGVRYDAETGADASDGRPQRRPRATHAPPELVATSVRLGGLGSSFTVTKRGKAVAEVKLAVPGFHNVLNAVAALAALDAAGVEAAGVAKALASFPGTARRFEPKGTFNGARIFDDYAHHPTEVTATLATARKQDSPRVVAVFQPHLYSRTLHLARDFGRALALADEIVVLEVYPAREQPTGELAGVSGKLVADAVADAAPGRPVWWLPGAGEAVALLRDRVGEGDLVLTIGAGDVFKVGEELVGGP